MELPHIGKNCSFPTCNQIDFLPFQCDQCGGTFCLQHKSREQHACTVEPQLAPSQRTAGADKYYTCAVASCEKRELAQFECHHCGLNLCISHRLQEDHQCVKLPIKLPKAAKNLEHVRNISAPKEPSKPRPKPTDPRSVQMAAKLALMTLKGTALGDSGIPQEERVYFKLVLPLQSGKPALPLFFSKVWTVGKIIDVITDRAGLPNNNNTTAAHKLRLFHGALGTKLETGTKISELMSDSSLCLVNGGTLILETVADNVVVLENLEDYKL